MTTENEERCDYRVGSVRCCRRKGHSMKGMEGGHRFKCAGKYCPGLGWVASNTPHPTSCSIDFGGRHE